MMRSVVPPIPIVCALLLIATPIGAQDEATDEVFSGPQAGEPLVAFQLRPTIGGSGVDATLIDPVAEAGDGPILLIFFHQRTRPAFGLTNTLMRYAATRKKDGLSAAVVMLSDDITATEQWMNTVRRNFPENTLYGVSPDGIEGPGAYGLNREVALTILLGKARTVTANFALIQPSAEADGPKIAQALADVLGDKEPIDLAAFAGNRMMDDRGNARRPGQDEAIVRRYLLAVINATEEDAAREAISAAEKIANRRGQLNGLLNEVAEKMMRDGVFDNVHQETARAWLISRARQAGPSSQLRELLRPVIQKDATVEQVREAALLLEEHMAANPFDAEKVRILTNRIIDAGRLETYGTTEAQLYLTKWATESVKSEDEAPPKKDE